MKNPPAFPVNAGPDGNDATNDGMTLRDYFAAKAMQGILANYKQFYSGEADEPAISRWSYEIVDAMLKAREP